MGQDLGEFDEWNEDRSVEWNLAEVPEHKGISVLVKELNHLYRTLPALYERDDAPEGFEWVNHISAQDCYLTYLRKGEKTEETLLVVANFAGVEREITTGTPYAGKYKEIFNSDSEKYGGTGIVNNRLKRAKAVEWDDRPYSVTVKMAPLSLSILKYIPYTEEEMAKEKEAQTAEEKAKKTLKDAGKKGKAAASAKASESAEETETAAADKAAKKAAKGSPSEQAAAKESGEPEASAEKKTGKTAKTPEHSVHRTTAVNVVKEAVPETKKAAKTSGKKAAAKKEGKEPQKTSEKPARKSAKKADGKSVKKAAETESA